MRPEAQGARRPRVMHVASGGFSGATQVALDLTRGATNHESLLVLRRKRRTPMERVQRLQREGVPLVCVAGWSHAATVWELGRLCRHWKPDIVVGHGFPEHLLARWGGLWARKFGGLPHHDGGASRPLLVHVEHNMRERYTGFKRWQARQLAPHTAAFVGVSAAVAGVLQQMGLPQDRVTVVRNGVSLEPFSNSEQHPWDQREPAIIMAARFGAQKDHATLIEAMGILRERHGLRPVLRLAGGGSAAHRQQAQAQVDALGLGSQVEFLGHRPDLPSLLMQHQVAALSTHYEGLPLILAEAMAAGCAVVGSDVAAVRETLGDGQWGWLAQHQNPSSWADVLAQVLRGGPQVQAQAATARMYARSELCLARMVGDYEALFSRLVHTSAVRA